MKYAIGDKVKVIRDDHVSRCSFIGEIGIVCLLKGNGSVGIDFSKRIGSDTWNLHVLELPTGRFYKEENIDFANRYEVKLI